MKKFSFFAILFFVASIFFAMNTPADVKSVDEKLLDSLRYIYERTPDRWPKPTLDPGVAHIELGVLPGSPLDPYKDSLKPIIELGKTLFFDPRLSSSNQISCGSCHDPDLGWADGRTVAVGHDHQRGTRNTQSIKNSWFYTTFFWDGRASSLEDQAKNPISNPIEMHQDFDILPSKLSEIKGYQPLFISAFGDATVSPERIASALATFQRTVTSSISDFDYFMAGLSNRLTDQQVHGLHLFRTKGQCLNCHNGPFLSDNKFHNLNTTFYKDEKRQDLGLYDFTKDPNDVGKFRTPGLRNVMNTGPWFHNGIFKDMRVVMTQYNMGMRMLGAVITSPSKEEPMKPVISPHIRTLSLNLVEINAIIAFMQSLSESPSEFDFPELPKKEK